MALLDSLNGDECVNDSDFPPRYCPECGAEVVSDDD